MQKSVRLSVSFVLLWLLSIPASAQTLAHCVQRGLTDAGFDTQGVDGLPGNNTYTAAKDYLAANPDVELPGLIRATKRDAEVLKAWCFNLIPPKMFYGTAFKQIKHAASGEWIAAPIGPVVLEWHEVAGTAVLTSSWPSGLLVSLGKIEPVPNQFADLPNRFLNERTALTTRSRVLSFAPGFLGAWAETPSTVRGSFKSSQPKYGVSRQDLLWFGEDGFVRASFHETYTNNSPEFFGFYRLAPVDLLVGKNEMGTVDWAELERKGFTLPTEAASQ